MGEEDLKKQLHKLLANGLKAVLPEGPSPQNVITSWRRDRAWFCSPGSPQGLWKRAWQKECYTVGGLNGSSREVYEILREHRQVRGFPEVVNAT